MPKSLASLNRQILSDVNELIKCWSDFDSNPDYYISAYLPSLLANPQKGTMRERLLVSCIDDKKLLIEAVKVIYEQNKGKNVQRRIEVYLRNYDFASADALYNSNRDALLDYDAMRTLAVQEQERVFTERIIDCLKNYRFDEAERIARLAQSPKVIDFYRESLEEAKRKKEKEERKRFIAAKIFEVQSCLHEYRFGDAEAAYAAIKNDYPESIYRELVADYKKRQIKDRKTEEIKECLERNQFEAADNLYLDSGLFLEGEYAEIKAPFIKNFISTKYSKSINDEKAEALSIVSQSHLLSARAGSGKTSVLAYKASMLMDCYGVNPDHILILAFNKKAAAEIKGRIQKDMNFHAFENARTFHGLAYQLVNPKANLLFDDGEGDLSRPALSSFVQDLLRKIWTPNLQEKIYAFFRKEMISVGRSGALLNDKEYYLYVRNQRDITLGGERVKSTGEKYLADFLFEHDIPYSYEALEFWSGHNYHPDFSLYGHKMTIEFWGIDENDPRKHVPAWWDVTWEQYRTQMVEKRSYWREKNIPLIEFSVADLRSGREAFEALIKTQLEEAGVACEKLPQKELEKRVVRNQIDRLTSLFVQFIQKAKKRMWDTVEVQQRLLNYAPADEREHIFLQLASRIYADYQAELANRSAMDFDDLMMQAANLIEQTSGECGIGLGARKDRFVKMNDLKWVLIDEYQDFSALFFNVIQSIRKYNPQVNLLCVGDDWQAINSFAGSDLTYFTNFTGMFGGQQTSLLTNFRSQKAIVEGGNAVMQGFGKPGQSLPEKQGGAIIQQSVNKVWVEWREGDAYAESRKKDERFVFYEKRENGLKVNDNGFINARYLKACYQIITDKDNWEKIVKAPSSKKDKISVAILSRTNYMERIMLSEFERKLHACFSPEEKKQLGDSREKIRAGTAHSFKGLEADIVIILRANEGAFPLIHPDNALFKFFGQTEKDVLDEERRLFYVAVTRAAEKLYILTEDEHESPFLQDLISRENIL